MQNTRVGRPRSKYNCPKCDKQGYLEKSASRNGNYPNAKYRKYWRVVHYDSITKKKSFCHVDYIIWEMEKENWKRWWVDYKNKLEAMSPTEFQEEYIRMQKEHQEMRTRIRLEKQAFKELELNYEIKSN